MKGRSEAVALADEIDHSEESGYLPAPALFELWLGAGRSARGRKEIRKILVTGDRDFSTVSREVYLRSYRHGR